MLHPVHFFIDSLSFLALQQPQMQVCRDINLKGEGIVRIDPQQL
jgi:hypothetical protein